MAVSNTNNGRDEYVESVREELQREDETLTVGKASGELKQRVSDIVNVFVEETDIDHDEAAWVIHKLGEDIAAEQDFLTFLEMRRLQRERGEEGQIRVDDLERWVDEMREEESNRE